MLQTPNSRLSFDGGTHRKAKTSRAAFAILLVGTMALGACQSRLPNILSGNSAPRDPVQTSELPPLQGQPAQQGQPFDPNAPAPQPGAVAPAPAAPAASQPFDPAAAANQAAGPIPQQPTIAPQPIQPVAQVAPAQPIQPTAPAAPAAPVAPAVQISRADMLGAWKLVSSTDNCQLFMTLTTWTGGYRATTKSCTAPELANITAWDLKDNRVILVGATGSSVATLTPNGGSRFSGTTKGGNPISVSQ